MLPPDVDLASAWSPVPDKLLEVADWMEGASATPDAEDESAGDDWIGTDCACIPELSIPVRKAMKIRELIFRNIRIRSTHGFLSFYRGGSWCKKQCAQELTHRRTQSIGTLKCREVSCERRKCVFGY